MTDKTLFTKPSFHEMDLLNPVRWTRKEGPHEGYHHQTVHGRS
jgi:hypothetical protein